MAIKVYGISTYNSQRVVSALLEFGVEDFELIKVDLMTRANYSPEFLAIQPFHQVPVFECGEFRLCESRAIVRYIAEKYKDQGPDLLGSTPEEKALVNQWVEFEAHQFSVGGAAPWSFEHFMSWLKKRPLDETLLAPLHQKMEHFLDVVEKQLAKTKYLAGDAFSMADLNIAPCLLQMSILDPELINGRKLVKSWFDTITSRPAFQKALQADDAWRGPVVPFTREEAQKPRA